MRINRQRLEQSMERLGRIGETPKGGLTRLALSDARGGSDTRDSVIGGSDTGGSVMRERRQPVA